jgi:hypothetical protein
MSRSYPLPTDTRAIHIESRQYNIGNFDLGQGLPRIALKIGGFFYLPWWLLLFKVGIPILGPAMMLWVVPPTLALTHGLQLDAGERLRLASWADWAMWVLRAHTPIVNGDTTSPVPAAPIATPVAFLAIDLTTVTHAAAEPFVPAGVRDDFYLPRPKGAAHA